MRTRLVGTTGGMVVLLFLAAPILSAAKDPPPAAETPPADETQSAAAAQQVAEPKSVGEPAGGVIEQDDDAVATESLAKPRPLRHGVFRWTSYPAAWTAAQKTNRPILMFVTSPGCPHCVKMISQTYQAPHISPLVAESFETVYINRAVQPELVAKLKVRWFPTTIIVGTNNKVVDVLEGYVEPLAFTQRLKTGLAASTPATQTR